MTYEKIILVTRKTRLDGLVERFNTRGQARFYLEHSGGSFDLYLHEHETYYAALKDLERRLQSQAKVHTIERSFLPNFVFAESDLVVTIGVDGLVVNTAKYLDGQPLVAVNPDPAQVDGVLLPFTVPSGAQAVGRVLRGQFQARRISMAEARTQDGQSLLAFNDLFIGARSHVSARYALQVGEQRERQSSSGVIVSTGAGATGWLSSLFNMANGMLAAFGAQPTLSQPHLGWEAEQLLYVVREPFISKSSGAGLVCGRIDADHPLQIESEMPEGGVIFSDGVEADFLVFNAGSQATIGLSAKKTRLVVS